MATRARRVGVGASGGASGAGAGSTTTSDTAAGRTTASTDAASNPRSTLGLRVPHHTHTVGITTNDYAQGTWFTRHTADATLTANRVPASPTAAWVGFAQSVDTVGVSSPNAASPNLHVTRSVLDLKDQVLQVFDARDLGFATWTFAYDQRGRRLSAAHATGVGSRWSLPDAAGNPIWSRDAKAMEVDRTFDELSRPLQEESDGGTMVKLRRAWTYMVPYSASDTASKNANLFGRVEEERDQDGLRYFEYDWRGLVTKVSHRFWDADWQTAAATIYTNTDEAAVPSAARGSLSTWLVLSGLTDTTTVVVSTTYDAAGRPMEELWPQGQKRRWTYNAAGQLEKVEYDGANGPGYEIGVQATTYNARGQSTGYTHANGVVCTREYDPTTERLTRIFARKPTPTEVRFQDLAYAYDPVGNPVQITDQLATSTFTSNQIIPNNRTFRYDPRYRLVRSTGKRHKNATDGVDAPVVPSPALTDYLPYTHRYSYDAVGNSTTNQEYKSGTNNLRYKAGLPDLFDGFGAETYSYDANGCCTATPRHAAMGYAFDAQAVFVDMGGSTKVRYRRHGDQRVVRCLTKTGVSGLGVYLGPWEYHRRTGSTAYVKTVLHVEAKSRVAQAERVLTGADASSLPVFHVHADHLGSAQALTKADGTLLCQEEFFAYGRSSDRRDSRNRYRYIGVERDEETGLCMTGPRTYDPVVGRFLQGDPLVGGAPYVYSSGNPLRRKDGNGYADGDTVAPETTGEIAEKSFPRLVIEEMGRGLLGVELSPENSDIAADAAAKYTRGAADSAASAVTSPYSPLNWLNTLFASAMTGSVARGSEVVGAAAEEQVAGVLDPALGMESKAPGDYFYEGGKSSYTAVNVAYNVASLAAVAGAVRGRVPPGGVPASRRALTSSDLGLPDDVIVQGTFSIRGAKATAKVDYLGEGGTGIGSAIFGMRTSLVSAAKDAGATTLRIETSYVIEETGILLRGLTRAGFQPRSNGTMWWEGTVK